MCIIAFKEAIIKYRDLSSNVYTCFLDVMQWEGIPHSGNIRFHVAHVRNFIGFPGIIDLTISGISGEFVPHSICPYPVGDRTRLNSLGIHVLIIAQLKLVSSGLIYK